MPCSFRELFRGNAELLPCRHEAAPRDPYTLERPAGRNDTDLSTASAQRPRCSLQNRGAATQNRHAGRSEWLFYEQSGCCGLIAVLRHTRFGRGEIFNFLVIDGLASNREGGARTSNFSMNFSKVTALRNLTAEQLL